MKDIIEYFNQCPAKSMATVDHNGNPNVCLCGSAIMADIQTVHALYGYFDQSYKNLKNNPSAVFLASKGFSEAYWRHFEATGEKLYTPGYRVYCKLVGESSDPDQLSRIKSHLLPRVGNRVVSGFKTLLIFRVEKIGEIYF